MVIQHKQARARENFPVASWLLPRAARKRVLAYYDFARGADNIADDPHLSADEKLAQLAPLEEGLKQADAPLPIWAEAYCAIARADAAFALYAQELLVAFVQDATQQRYADMDALRRYCRYSAAPVGRLVLAACDENAVDLEASDALCGALQLINHLQDLREDYLLLDRVYLPQNVMAEHGMEEAELSYASHMEVRHVHATHTVIDQIDAWLVRARPLLHEIKGKRLRLEVAFIWHIAYALACKLRTHDLFLEKVRASRFDYAKSFLRAIASLWQS